MLIAANSDLRYTGRAAYCVKLPKVQKVLFLDERKGQAKVRKERTRRKLNHKKPQGSSRTSFLAVLLQLSGCSRSDKH